MKRHGGIVDISQNDVALDRLVTIAPTLCKMVLNHYSLLLCMSRHKMKETKSIITLEKTLTKLKRVVKNAKELRNSLETHCNGNPFKSPMASKTSPSWTIIPVEIKLDFLDYAKKGEAQFSNFIAERLLMSSSLSISFLCKS